jgi:hypothetical protein
MQLEMQELTTELKRSRGKRYGVLIRQVYELLNDELQTKARKKDTLSINDVALLAVEYNLQLKHCFEFLEWSNVLPSGTYERFLWRGLKTMKVMQNAREKYNASNAK